MKHLITIAMLILFAQFGFSQALNYSNLWEKVSQFENDNLPKSALQVVESIQLKAEKENQQLELVKCLIYKSKYLLILEEDATLKVVANFKDEIAKSKFPIKNILHSYLGNIYLQYFLSHQHQYFNRTKTNEIAADSDFRSWDLETLYNETQIQYNKSLDQGLQLQLEDIVKYQTLLVNNDAPKSVCPTLLDLLSYEAIQFYKNNINQISKPTHAFNLDNPNYLAPARDFNKLQITAADSTSANLSILKIYQNLINFHLKDNNPEVCANIDIERLNFVYNNATFSNKNEVLINTLKNESEQDKTGLYVTELAENYYQESLNYNPNTAPEKRWKAKEALELCNTVIAKFPKQFSAQKSKALKQQIESPQLSLVTESFLPIAQFSKLLVRYKNLNQLNFKICAISQKTYEDLLKKNEAEIKDFLSTLNSTTQWESNLRDEKDYQTHTTEIEIPKLNNGRYVIIATTNQKTDVIAYANIQITDLALIEKENSETGVFQLINRIHGAPIENANISLNFSNYNAPKITTKNYTTNHLGEIYIEKSKIDYYSNITSTVNYKNDTAYFGNYNISRAYEHKSEKNEIYKGFVFTDRGIYRPGQTVYFKALFLLQKPNNTSTVLPNENLNVKLFNVNHELVSTLTLKTNSFGSVSGNFVLPNQGLNGFYTIEIRGENKLLQVFENISVEDYKRPKFEATFNPIADAYKVNETITVNGKAMAYSGSAISDAKVVYKVTRNVQSPIWFYRIAPQHQGVSQEISHGETSTNTDGSFNFKFTALPDGTVNPETLPIFSYDIVADITDINGETRTCTTTVNVGYHALLASISLNTPIHKNNSKNTITINTENLNHTFIGASGSLKIYKLVAPNRVLRPRPWEAPDYQDIPEATFLNHFPNEAYTNNNSKDQWPLGAMVFEEAFNTNKAKEVSLGNIKKWQPGAYKIILESQDKFAQKVRTEQFFELDDSNEKTISDNALFSINTDKSEYKPGDTALITFASATNISVSVIIDKANTPLKTEIINLNNSKKSIKIPITENDFGGFNVAYSFAAFNSFESNSKSINVPYPKAALEIETESFRDQLSPGANETWTFKIKGPKGEKVSAEILASMYDASLDQFLPFSWNFSADYPIHFNPKLNYVMAHQSFGFNHFNIYNLNPEFEAIPTIPLCQLNLFGFQLPQKRFMALANTMAMRSGGAVEEQQMQKNGAPAITKMESDTSYTDASQNTDNATKPNVKPIDLSAIKIRENLQETAFFYPQLQTDAKGNVSFSFTSPEALTQWKLQLFAHTQNATFALKELSTVTQKELMVTPNTPRFLREGDTITISSKIANLTSKTLTGDAVLELSDAVTGNILNSALQNTTNSKSFTVNANSNTQVSWTLVIPKNCPTIQYKIAAKSNTYSDGEQHILPVLSNRTLVTETLPLWVGSNETKTFTLNKLKQNQSTTLNSHKLSLEVTSNPAWYAVQALPYLMEYPYDCNEQTFSRLYANVLAQHIAQSNPKIKAVFNQWNSSDALLSNLEKNADLKSILIAETPWLRDAENETEQKKRIALLFDFNHMQNETQLAISKLKNNQMYNGAWAWFNGGKPNRYMTQYIVSGFGHLAKLGVTINTFDATIKKALTYLDAAFIEEYTAIKKENPKADLTANHLTDTQLNYMYMRSFYKAYKPSKEVENVMVYYQTQIQKYWVKNALYSQGLMALISYRNNDLNTAHKILKSLEENSINSDELGRYWKANENSWYWYKAPIETQALMIEAFSEISQNNNIVDQLKVWLLKNKQTTQWKTTKATSNSIYALLLQGGEWLNVHDAVAISIGHAPISAAKLETVKTEAATGYYKVDWNTDAIKNDLAEVTLTKKGEGIAWGALYWQYFEDLDQITAAETPLKLDKKLYLKTNTNTGEVLTEITKNTAVKVGDVVRIRITLRCDRAMEFIHMKDMRAAGLEPVNVISAYQWQDGLGYYQSTKDASTNFFFDYLPKGVYVFEYDLRVNNAGQMSNGITTIQSMYAPEFSSHSNGVRINVN